MKKIFYIVLLVPVLILGQSPNNGKYEDADSLSRAYTKWGHAIMGQDGATWQLITVDGNGNLQTEPAGYDSVGYADSTVSTIWKAIPLDFEATLVEVFAITPVDIKVSPDTTADSLYVKGGWVQTLLIPVDTLYAKSTTGSPHVIVNHYK